MHAGGPFPLAQQECLLVSRPCGRQAGVLASRPEWGVRSRGWRGSRGSLAVARARPPKLPNGWKPRVACSWPARPVGEMDEAFGDRRDSFASLSDLGVTRVWSQSGPSVARIDGAMFFEPGNSS